MKSAWKLVTHPLILRVFCAKYSQISCGSFSVKYAQILHHNACFPRRNPLCERSLSVPVLLFCYVVKKKMCADLTLLYLLRG